MHGGAFQSLAENAEDEDEEASFDEAFRESEGDH